MGDVPIIEKGDLDINNYNNMIFPLSNTAVFIYSDSGKKNINSFDFYLNKDLAIFHQSQKFVVCKDKQYVEKIIYAFAQIENAGLQDDILKYIFNYT